TATQNQTLTAANTLSDVDGLGIIGYQWKANGANISGATGSTYLLSAAEVGKTITVAASYTDGHGTAESMSSSATLAVAPISNTLVGTAGNDNLTGTVGNDAINGLGGNDTLNGGAGADTMTGGAGNDTYIVDNLGDVVTETSALLAEIDTVQASITYSLATLSYVENLTLTGTAAIDGAGNTRNNVIIGNANNNILDGGAGNDWVYYSNATSGVTVNLSLTTAQNTLGAGTDTLLGFENILGSSYNDTLTGNSLNNTLNGGAGADTLIGGTGNDTYVVDNIDDIVTETATLATEVDTVQSSITYSLATLTYVENLTLTGTSAINGTGNALNNVLIGNSAVNTLNGGAGNDRLDGKAGADRMSGGTGDDIYVVDNTKDTVTENTNEGIDTVESSITYTLKANVEALLLTGSSAINGTDNTLNNLLIGNAAVNTLTAGTGNDILQGGAGNDILKDTAGSNLLDGGLGNDTLTGNAANELFIGGTGNDTITTGNGYDIIAFNRGDGQDILNGGVGKDNTLSLGGGIQYADLALSKTGNDLILEVGGSDQITLKNWYDTSVNYKSVLDLQVMADAMSAFDSASPDPLLNKAVQQFDFTAIANSFDAARGANATFMHWSALNSLLPAYLSGSDSAAFGGDLAHQYGKNGTLTGMNLAAAQSVINDPLFGAGAQTLHPLQGLQGGSVSLG
ncbi:MAG: hypothetical protein Q8L69_00060, partial [Gallionellaceae bacterium]|nr:hypothetical protein [Gallionellaceae bacterium]